MKEIKFSQEVKTESDLLVVINRLFDLGMVLWADRVELCKAVTMVSELATNLIKYAKEGRMELCVYREKDAWMLKTVALDQGPGIENLSLALEDNFSTANSYGVGLPSVKRLSDAFSIKSKSSGTRIETIKKLGVRDA